MSRRFIVWSGVVLATAVAVAGGAAFVLTGGSEDGAGSQETFPSPPPPPQGRPPPPPPTRLPDPSLVAGVDRVLRRLPKANIVFTTPKTLDIDESAPIVLLFSTRRSIQDLKTKLDRFGTTEGARIRFTDVMTARLIGPDFRISNLTDEEQLVSAVEDTEWKWRVEPKRAGVLHLNLRLTAHIEIKDNDPRASREAYSAPRTIETFERTLTIKAIPESTGDKVLGFLGDNWQWLFTVLVLPLAAWAIRRRRKEDSPPPPPAPPASPPT